MNHEKIKQQLDQLMLTTEELNSDWNDLDDPLPKTNETVEMYGA